VQQNLRLTATITPPPLALHSVKVSIFTKNLKQFWIKNFAQTNVRIKSSFNKYYNVIIAFRSVHKDKLRFGSHGNHGYILKVSFLTIILSLLAV